MIVTSRVIGYQRSTLDAAGFTHYLLQDLDTAQIREFTAAWYASSCPQDRGEATRLRDRLLIAVRDSPAVAELAGNPLLLTILAIIGRRQELPRDRRAVYEHAVSVLAGHWDVGKHLPPGLPYLSHEEKLELLRLAARRMQDAPRAWPATTCPARSCAPSSSPT